MGKISSDISAVSFTKMKSTLTLTDKVPSWNQMYAGMHWSKRRTKAIDWHNIIIAECIKQKIPKFESADITVISTSKRPLDPDNICAKIIIDGLTLMKIIPDDSPKYVHSVLLISKKGKEETTEIIIEGAKAKVKRIKYSNEEDGKFI